MRRGSIKITFPDMQECIIEFDMKNYEVILGKARVGQLDVIAGVEVTTWNEMVSAVQRLAASAIEQNLGVTTTI